MINIQERLDTTQIRSLLTFGLGISYLGNLFLCSSIVSNVNFILIVSVIVLSFTAVRGSAKVIGHVTFSLSIFLLLYSHAPLSVWQDALRENMTLIVMFMMVPLLSIPIQHGGYMDALQSVFQRHVSRNNQYYLLVSIFSAFLSVLVSLAAINIVYEISRASRQGSNKKLLGSALTRGFNTYFIWAPTAVGIALVLQLTGIEWLQFLPYALFFAVIAGFVGYALSRIEQKEEKEQEQGESGSPPVEHREGDQVGKVVELSVFACILIVAIAAISALTGLSTILVVAYLSLLYPILWLAALKRLPVFLTEFKEEYFQHRLPKLKDELILFVGAGLLANSINYSHLGDYVPKILSLVVGDSALLLTIVIFGIVIVFSGLGVHPIVTVTILGGTLDASSYGISSLYFGLVLAVSWAMGNAISPAAANVIGTSGLLGVSTIQVGIHWNGWYVVITSVIAITLLTLFRMIGML